MDHADEVTKELAMNLCLLGGSRLWVYWPEYLHRDELQADSRYHVRNKPEDDEPNVMSPCTTCKSNRNVVFNGFRQQPRQYDGLCCGDYGIAMGYKCNSCKKTWAANDPAYYESTWFIDGGYPKAASTDIEIGVDETQTTLDGFFAPLPEPGEVPKVTRLKPATREKVIL